jgi:hypothetical protein
VQRIPLLASVVTAAVFLASSAAPTIAATRIDEGSSPVAIEACRAYTMNAGKAASKTSTVEILFHDVGAVAAHAVGFDVNWGGGDVQTIRDVGTFSPGVTIAHKFQHPDPEAYSPLFLLSPVTCRVQSVQLANGSAWSNAGGDKS